MLASKKVAAFAGISLALGTFGCESKRLASSPSASPVVSERYDSTLNPDQVTIAGEVFLRGHAKAKDPANTLLLDERSVYQVGNKLVLSDTPLPRHAEICVVGKLQTFKSEDIGGFNSDGDYFGEKFVNKGEKYTFLVASQFQVIEKNWKRAEK